MADNTDIEQWKQVNETFHYIGWRDCKVVVVENISKIGEEGMSSNAIFFPITYEEFWKKSVMIILKEAE